MLSRNKVGFGALGDLHMLAFRVKFSYGNVKYKLIHHLFKEEIIVSNKFALFGFALTYVLFVS